MRLLLVAVALALLIPHSNAQAPPNPCGPLTLGRIEPSSAALTPGNDGTFSVTVVNGNQFSTVNGVVVQASTTTAGWSVKSGQQSVASLAPGGSARVTFNATATRDAKADMAISLSASGTCAAPSPVPGAPLTCPSGVTQCQLSAATTGVYPLQQGGGLGFPGLGNLDFPVEYLIAGVVLVALAIAIPLLIRKRKAHLSADCPEPLKMVRPGRGTSFPIDIRNPTGEPITATFEVGAVPEGWSAFMPLPEVQLAPRETRSLWLMVRAPADAATGATADVEVRLRDGAKPDATASVKVRAEVDPNAAEGPTRVA